MNGGEKSQLYFSYLLYLLASWIAAIHTEYGRCFTGTKCSTVNMNVDTEGFFSDWYLTLNCVAVILWTCS